MVFLAGIILIILGFNGVERCGVIGVVVLFFGIIIEMAKAEEEETRARANWRKYWDNMDMRGDRRR